MASLAPACFGTCIAASSRSAPFCQASRPMKARRAARLAVGIEPQLACSAALFAARPAGLRR